MVPERVADSQDASDRPRRERQLRRREIRHDVRKRRRLQHHPPIGSGPRFEIGVAPPLTRKVQAGVTYTDWWAITTTSQHPELAFEFITFLSEPDRLAVYNELVRTIPPRNDALTAA